MKIATAAATAHRLLNDVSPTSVEWHNVTLISDVIAALGRSKQGSYIVMAGKVASAFDSHWKAHQMCDSHEAP